jgi:hypothetical protein
MNGKPGDHPSTMRFCWRSILSVLLLSTAALAQTGGDKPAPAAPPCGTFAFKDSLTLAGTSEKIFDAITGDISGWWDHSFSDKPYRLFIEPKPGGGFYEIFNKEGEGVLHATVTAAVRGKLLRFVGPLGLAGRAIDMVTTYEFAAVGVDSTKLTLSVHAAGELDAGLGPIVRGVWKHFLVERFKPYVEGGKRER